MSQRGYGWITSGKFEKEFLKAIDAVAQDSSSPPWRFFTRVSNMRLNCTFSAAK